MYGSAASAPDAHADQHESLRLMEAATTTTPATSSYHQRNYQSLGAEAFDVSSAGGNRRRGAVASAVRLGVAGLAMAAVTVGVVLSGGRRQAAVDALSATSTPSTPSAHSARGTEETDLEKVTMVVPTDGEGYSGTYVFKQTVATMDARGDNEFLVDALGFMMDINTTVFCSPSTPGFAVMRAPCAVRTGVIGALIPEIHLYQSFITPEGR